MTAQVSETSSVIPICFQSRQKGVCSSFSESQVEVPVMNVYSSARASALAPQGSMADKLAPSTRHKFEHEGRTIYEWDQTITEVNVYVEVPPGIKSKALFCTVTTNHVSLGLQGNPPYLDHDLAGSVKVSESFWTLEDSTLHVSLTKAQQGEPWASAFQGHGLDPMAKQQEQERLMLERFQMEHPGFDFSDAKFTGQAPNPRTFMGGMKTT